MRGWPKYYVPEETRAAETPEPREEKPRCPMCGSVSIRIIGNLLSANWMSMQCRACGYHVSVDGPESAKPDELERECRRLWNMPTMVREGARDE